MPMLAAAGAQKVFENIRPLIGRDFAEVLGLIWPEPFASEVISRFRHTLLTGEPYNAPGMVERRRDINSVESYDWKIERMTLPDGRLGVVCHLPASSGSRHRRHKRRMASAPPRRETCRTQHADSARRLFAR